MNRKHRQTLSALFARPDKKDIRWDDFIGLLMELPLRVIELGADVSEKGGSMVGLRLNGRYAVFHRPHPGNLIYPSMLKRIRRFFDECGVKEDQDA